MLQRRVRYAPGRASTTNPGARYHPMSERLTTTSNHSNMPASDRVLGIRALSDIALQIGLSVGRLLAGWPPTRQRGGCVQQLGRHDNKGGSGCDDVTKRQAEDSQPVRVRSSETARAALYLRTRLPL